MKRSLRAWFALALISLTAFSQLRVTVDVLRSAGFAKIQIAETDLSSGFDIHEPAPKLSRRVLHMKNLWLEPEWPEWADVLPFHRQPALLRHFFLVHKPSFAQNPRSPPSPAL